MELSSELKRLRESGRLTLRELSEGTGISNAYLNQLENDRIKEPSPNIIAKLSGFYGVSYQRLMKLAGYMVPSLSGNGTSGRGPVQIEGLKDLSSDDLAQVRDFVDFLRSKRTRPGK